MGKMKQHLMGFQESWAHIVDAAHRGVEAHMVEAVAEVLGTFVEIWDEGPKHWIVPAGMFQGLEVPIEVSPAFRGRVNAYLDAIQEEAFNEWVRAMEADPLSAASQGKAHLLQPSRRS